MITSTIKTAIKLAVGATGFELRRAPLARPVQASETHAIVSGYDRAHYGCGSTLLAGWLNMDMPPRPAGSEGPTYVSADITEPHPIASDSLRYAYCEDVLEHLTQEQSLRFLCEVKRTLAPDGVVRLSFPSFEAVLGCYDGTTDAARNQGRDCFDKFDHVHFYCREALTLVALKLGFRKVEFCGYRQSPHEALRDLDNRPAQADMNTYAELTK